MRRYRNLGGNSGVLAYDIAPESIAVRFKGGTVYAYTYRKPGPVHVEAMKKLAVAGRGLGTYISQHVQDRYESRNDPD